MAALPIAGVKTKIAEVKTRLRERLAQLPISDLPILQNRPKLLEGEGFLFRKQGTVRGEKGALSAQRGLGLGLFKGRPRPLRNITKKLRPAIVDDPRVEGPAVEREVYPVTDLAQKLSVEL